MRMAMGDPMLTTILDIKNAKRIYCHPPPTLPALQPTHPHIKRYNLQLSVTNGKDQVTLFHQVFNKWYQKVHKVDGNAIIYPWAVPDRAELPMPLIKNPTDALISLLALKKVVHKLFLQMTGRDYHIQVLMGMEEDFPTIIQSIGWWLKSTSQGMWLTDLQSAKETMCAGWLLFSAGEFDREALTQEIWNFCGVQVAI